MDNKETFNYLKHLEQIKPLKVKEDLVPYLIHKQQGEYTLEDYYNLPDEHRVELIDGVIYDMTAPTYIHQGLGGEIHSVLRDYIRKNKGKCMAFLSPADIQLDCDNKTMVQPDVFVICDRSKLKKRVLFGAPDLVIEVLSPSTRKKDMNIKTIKYKNAGVREYWMVDPSKKRIYVYEFDKSELPVVYTFEDCVPVGIWDGKCVVDFREIYEFVRFLDEMEE